MEAEAESHLQELWEEPSFATLCSFFNKFSAALALTPLSFQKLESLFRFDNQGQVDEELIDLHVQLLRRIGFKGVLHKSWERTLLKFCAIDSLLAAEYFQLERFGYGHTSLTTKLAILKTLCECQFDFNVKFKEQISSFESPELRVLPMGTDKKGLGYWYQMDGDCGIRVYCEEQDDASGATWSITAKTRAELTELIDRLERGEEVTDEIVSEVVRELVGSEAETKAEKQTEEAGDEVKKEESENATVNGSLVEAHVTVAVTENHSAVPPVVKTEPVSDEVAGTTETVKTEPVSDKAPAALDNQDVQDRKIKSEEEKDAPQPPSNENSLDSIPPGPSDSSQPDPAKSLIVPGKKGHLIDQFSPLVPAALPKKQRGKAKVKAQQETSGTDTKTTTDEKQRASDETKDDALVSEGAGEKAEATSEAVEASADKSDDQQKAIEADHLLAQQLVERRILPSRSSKTRVAQLSAAATKSSSAPQSYEDSNNSAEIGSRPASATPTEEEAANSDETTSVPTSDGDSDDDDFIPLSILRRRAEGRKLSTNLSPRKKKKAEETSSDDEEADEVIEQKKIRKRADDDSYCQKCHLGKSPELILLCDNCDQAWHTWCLRPPLWFVPDDDWFCPKCNHIMLIDKLKMALASLDQALGLKALADKRKERQARRQAQLDFSGVSVSNIITSRESQSLGRRTGETASRPNYCEEEQNGHVEGEDEMHEADLADVDKAAEEEEIVEELKQRSKGKPPRRNYAEKRHRRDPVLQDLPEAEDSEEEEEPTEPLIKSRSKRQRKSIDYSFKDFDDMIQEAVDENVEFKSDYRPPPARPSGVGRGKDMANILEATRTKEKELQERQTAAAAALAPAPKETNMKTEGEHGSVSESASAVASEGAAAKPVKTEECKPEHAAEEDALIAAEAAAARKASNEETDEDGSEGGESDEDEEGRASRGGRKVAKPPISKKKGQRHHHKLTDLDLDNMTESDSEEYKGTSGSDESEEENMSDDSEWDEPQGRKRAQPTRRSTRLALKPTESDEDFIASDSSEEDDDVDDRRRKKGGRGRKAAGKSSPRKKRRYESDSDDSTVKRKGKGGRKRGGRRLSDDSSEEESDSDPEFRPGNAKRRKKPSGYGDSGARRKGGRKRKRKEKYSGESQSEEEEEDIEKHSTITPGGKLLRARRGQVNYRALLNPAKFSEEEDEGESGGARGKASLGKKSFSKSQFLKGSNEDPPEDPKQDESTSEHSEDEKSEPLNAAGAISEETNSCSDEEEQQPTTSSAAAATSSNSRQAAKTKASVRRASKARIQSSSDDETEAKEEGEDCGSPVGCSPRPPKEVDATKSSEEPSVACPDSKVDADAKATQDPASLSRLRAGAEVAVSDASPSVVACSNSVIVATPPATIPATSVSTRGGRKTSSSSRGSKAAGGSSKNSHSAASASCSADTLDTPVCTNPFVSDTPQLISALPVMQLGSSATSSVATTSITITAVSSQSAPGFQALRPPLLVAASPSAAASSAFPRPSLAPGVQPPPLFLGGQAPPPMYFVPHPPRIPVNYPPTDGVQSHFAPYGATNQASYSAAPMFGGFAAASVGMGPMQGLAPYLPMPPGFGPPAGMLEPPGLYPMHGFAGLGAPPATDSPPASIATLQPLQPMGVPPRSGENSLTEMLSYAIRDSE